MNDQQIMDKLKTILITYLYVELSKEEIDPAANLQAVYQIDSLGFTELRFQCEEQFSIKITDEDFMPENFRSLDAVKSLVERCLHQSVESI